MGIITRKMNVESSREDNEIETGDCIAGVVQLELAGNDGS